MAVFIFLKNLQKKLKKALDLCPYKSYYTHIDSNEAASSLIGADNQTNQVKVIKMTVQQLKDLVANGTVTRSHTALTRGYVSRKTEGYVESYEGKFGKGYKHYEPNWDSSRYCNVTYYIFN